MGFSNTLKSNSVNEWKDYYLDYDRLRVRMKNRDFRTMLYNEVNKVNSFYFLLEKKAVDEKNSLFAEIISAFPGEYVYDSKAQTENTDTELSKKIQKDLDDPEGLDFDFSQNVESKSFLQSEGLASLIPLQNGYRKRKKEKHFTEFLHSLVKIKAYRDLNATGLLKLAKKYSEMNSNAVFYEKFQEKLKETYFYKSKRIDSIRNAVKKMYKRIFAKDQPEKAKSVFRRLGKSSKPLDVFYLISGLLIGVSITMISQFSDENPPGSEYFSKFKFTNAMNSVFFGFLFFGICLKAFKNYSINYKFIFNFDVVSLLNNSIYFLLVSIFMITNNILFLVGKKLSYLPLIQLLVPIAFIVNPRDVLFYNSRIYVTATFGRSVLLPVSTIRFRHFYFVDVLQSFRYPLEAIVTYFVKGEYSEVYALMLFLVFPIVRILQCLKRFSSSKLLFPHIANALKYTFIVFTVMLEILEKTYKDVGYLTTVKYVMKWISTISSFMWDVFVDWMIIRNRYTFPHGFYRFALGLNFMVRFYWIFPLLSEMLFKKQIESHKWVECISEIFRRNIWTMIRVEVEHLNNCDELKIKKSINLTAGEFFYKKDIEESYQSNMSNLITETEFETEMEGNKTEESVRIETTEEESKVEYEDEEYDKNTTESNELEE